MVVEKGGYLHHQEMPRSYKISKIDSRDG